MPLLSRLLRNWPLKLAAITLSLLVWVLVSAEETRSQLVGVQVVLDLPPGYALADALPEVRALVSGPGRDLIKLDQSPLSIYVTMPAAGGPRWHAVMIPADVRVPPQLQVTVTDVQPRELLVDVDRQATRLVPVALRGAAPPRRGWAVDSITLEPEAVQVSGARVRVAELDSIATEQLDLQDVDSTFAREVPLDTAGHPLLRFRPSRVVVKGRARPT